MKTYQFFLLLVISVFFVSSCAPPQGGGGFNNTGDGNNSFGQFDSSQPTDHGGVTCNSSSNQDPDFLNYLSSGTNVPAFKERGGTIPCQPNSDGGVIFKLRAVFGDTLDKSGQNNPTPLQMQATQSVLTLVVAHSLVGSTAGHCGEGVACPSVGAEFQGVEGIITQNNQAQLKFKYTGNNGYKEITLRGQFDAEFFTGNMWFTNEKRKQPDGSTTTNGAASGRLGKFKIHTNSAFF